MTAELANTLQSMPAAAIATASGKKSLDDFPKTEQVSFIIKHTVKPGENERYEEWLRNIIAEAAKFHGHQGVHIVRPSAGSHVYEIVVRFAARADAEAWVDSPTRHALVERLTPLVSEPENVGIKSGIDYWFTAATNGKPPKVWKQWLATVSVIWPLSMVLPPALNLLFRRVPVLGTFGVSQLAGAMCMVGLLTYVLMPPYTRLLSRWLSR